MDDSYYNLINIPRRSTQFANGRLVTIGPFSSRGLAAAIVNTGPKGKLSRFTFGIPIPHRGQTSNKNKLRNGNVKDVLSLTKI